MLGLDLLAAAHFQHFLGRHHHVGDEVFQFLELRLAHDLFLHLLLEVGSRCGRCTIWHPQRRAARPVFRLRSSGQSPGADQHAVRHSCRTKSTNAKNTIVSPTMMKTIMVVSQVSFHDGQVTLLASRAALPSGTAAATCGGARRALPSFAKLTCFFVSSAISTLQQFGRSGGTRTHGPRFWRPMLYQLSYTPKASHVRHVMAGLW